MFNFYTLNKIKVIYRATITKKFLDVSWPQKFRQITQPNINLKDKMQEECVSVAKYEEKNGGEEVASAADDGQTEPNLLDAPKRRVGMLLAYCGKNYYGLQLNRGDTSLPTIEGALFNALVKARVVPEICKEKSQQMKYSSSSRTDKGVSTCGLVVSLKLKLAENTQDLINQHLPQDIRVLEIKRATKSFHGKNNADARTYSYTMPTFPFSTPNECSHKYRITEEKLEEVRSILSQYKGTHSYHNFTSGKKMGESSAKRYIINFWTEPPFLHEDLEFITLKVKGQSFMIHQIRKMIGLLIVTLSGRASREHFERAFSEPLEDIPKAPGIGLILEQVHYDSYNRKQGHMYGGMDWSSSREAAEKFMKEYILPVVYNDEIQNKSMQSWLDSLTNHDFTGVKAKEQWNKQMQEMEEKKLRKQEQKELNEDDRLTNDPDSVSSNSATKQDEMDNNTISIASDPPAKRVKLENTC